jgi:phospholipase A-2-activating protein
MSSLSSDLSLFALSQSLQLHTGAVRTVDTYGDLLLSGGLDSAVYLYNNTQGPYEVVQSFEYHDNYVYCAKFCSDGARIVSGSMDCKAIVCSIQGDLLTCITGHEKTVNYVQELGGTLMTGSWDASAKLWDLATSTCLRTLTAENHSHGVTGLLTDSMVFTGSQSGYLNFWSKDGELIRSVKAHNDMIRDVICTDNGILTCSNDCTIQLWSLDGRPISTYVGHSGFVFAIAASPTGEIASGSDDRSARVWRDSACIDTVPHTNTVWDLTFNGAGDLITGGADCFIRVFTRDGSRAVSADDLTTYGRECEAASSSHQVGLDMKDVPGIDQLPFKQGKKDGEVAVFNNNGIPEAYLWHASTQHWERAGEICGVSGASNKKTYGGDYFFPAGEYEYIFDVDMGDGLPRKLPYNNTDNTLLTAEKFCARESVNRDNVQAIMKFLQTNAKPVGLLAPATAAAPQTFFKHFPIQQGMLFETLNISPIVNKIKELGSDPALVTLTQGEHGLTDKDRAQLDRFSVLFATASAVRTSEMHFKDIELLEKLLKWPETMIFPVLDLFRLTFLHQSSSAFFRGADLGSSIVNRITTATVGCPVAAGVITGLRALSNIFGNHAYAMAARRQFVLDQLAKFLDHDNKTVRLAWSSLMFNYSVQFCSKDDEEGRVQAISALCEVVSNEQEVDVLERALLTIGNLLVGGGKKPDIINLARELGLGDSLTARPLQGKLAEIKQELLSLLLS